MQKAMIKQRREAKEEAYNGAYNGVNNYNESGWVLNVRAVRRKKPSPAAAGGREEADEKMEARKQMEEVEAVKRIRATEKRIYLKRQDEERKQMEKLEARKQMEEVEAMKRIRATEKRIYLKRQDEERKQMEKARQEVEERRRILRQKYEVAYDTQYIQTSQTSTSLLKHAVMNKKGKHSHDNSCM